MSFFKMLVSVYDGCMGAVGVAIGAGASTVIQIVSIASAFSAIVVSSAFVVIAVRRTKMASHPLVMKIFKPIMEEVCRSWFKILIKRTEAEEMKLDFLQKNGAI